MNKCNSASKTVSGFDTYVYVHACNNMKYCCKSTNTLMARKGNTDFILDKYKVHMNYTSATIYLQN